MRMKMLAYLDPGAGSFLPQIVVGAVAALLYRLKSRLARIKKFLARIKGGRRP